MTTTALTSSTVEPVTPEYAESLGFLPSYTPGFMFIRNGNNMYYLQFRKGALVGSHLSRNAMSTEQLPQLPTRYTLAKIVEEFKHKGNG